MHNDNNSQQDCQNYRACFCLKLTPIHTKWHTRLSTKLRKPPFRFIRNINCIYMSFFCKCIILTDTIFLLRISTTISWITFFLSFLFRQPYCWLNFINIRHSIRKHSYCNITPIALRVYFLAWAKSHWFSVLRCLF